MTASAWTPETVARLKRLWAEGRSAGEIARALETVSRSAVLGKVYRLGLSAGRPRRAAASPRPSQASGPRVRGRPARVEGPARAAPLARPRPQARDAGGACAHDRPAGDLGLLGLRRGHCRWPYGEPETGITFCGRPVARGAFCEGHAGIAYRPPPGGSGALLALAGLS